MLTLVFAKTGPGPILERGPFQELRCDAQAIRAGSGGPVIARHADHCWHVGPDEYFRIDCSHPVLAYFEDPGGARSELHGPFLHFSSADGISYGDGEKLGHVDEDACLWYSHRDERHFKEMVIVPAS